MHERISKVIKLVGGVKEERRLSRVKSVTAFLVVFMKTVFSQYPTVMDLHIVGFCLVCLNLRFIKYLEAKILTIFIFGITGVNTLFMWLTWLDRFSGNANFFFFQSMVFNLCLVVLFIQAYQSLNTKLLKYLPTQNKELKTE